MTDKELRVRVAELCGYHECGYRHQDGYIDNDGVFKTTGPLEFSIEGSGIMTDSRGRIVPDYPYDLNAMHEAELHMQQKLGATAWLSYVDLLRRNSTGWGGAGAEVSATARQRAEAFVKAMEIQNG